MGFNSGFKGLIRSLWIRPSNAAYGSPGFTSRPDCGALRYNDLTIHLITSQRLRLMFLPSFTLTDCMQTSLILFVIPAVKIQAPGMCQQIWC